MACFHHGNAKGFSLVELAIVIVAIGIFAAFALANVRDIPEQSEATVIESVQRAVENTVTTAATHMDITPAGLMIQPNAMVNVITASRVNTTQGATLTVTGARTFRLSFDGSGRLANYSVNNCGEVCLIAPLTGFQRYQLDNTQSSCQAAAGTGCAQMQRI